MKFDLFEMLGTNIDVKWINHGKNHAGFFTLDGVDYTVYVDEIEGNGKTVVDVGFKTRGSQDFLDGKKSISKVLGAVINALKSKINEINPYAVIIMVSKKDRAAAKRKLLYTKLIHYVDKFFTYQFRSDWIETSEMWISFISKNNISKSEIEEIADKLKGK